MQTIIKKGQLADDTSEVEHLMEEHNDLKARIDNREKTLHHLIQQVRGLPAESTNEGRLSPGAGTEAQLMDSWSKLNAAWETRRLRLQQCQQYLVICFS